MRLVANNMPALIEKHLRMKCRCGQPARLNDHLCANCRDGKRAPTPVKLWTCPRCGDTTDDPSNLCKCLD